MSRNTSSILQSFRPVSSLAILHSLEFFTTWSICTFMCTLQVTLNRYNSVSHCGYHVYHIRAASTALEFDPRTIDGLQIENNIFYPSFRELPVQYSSSPFLAMRPLSSFLVSITSFFGCAVWPSPNSNVAYSLLNAPRLRCEIILFLGTWQVPIPFHVCLLVRKLNIRIANCNCGSQTKIQLAQAYHS